MIIVDEHPILREMLLSGQIFGVKSRSIAHERIHIIIIYRETIKYGLRFWWVRIDDRKIKNCRNIEDLIEATYEEMLQLKRDFENSYWSTQ